MKYEKAVADVTLFENDEFLTRSMDGDYCNRYSNCGYVTREGCNQVYYCGWFRNHSLCGGYRCGWYDNGFGYFTCGNF